MDATEKKGKLLIVDDEITFLQILERMFQKHYDLRSATSASEAMNILEKGFQPSVIITDQRMPVTSGSELLEKSMKLAPNAIRIILTGFTSPKDIIQCINQGHAYMFIQKPAEELELIQAVKIAFDTYNSTNKSKQQLSEFNNKIKDLTASIGLLKKQIADTGSLFNQTAIVIGRIVQSVEKLYFTNHTKSVILIAKSIAEALDFDSETISKIVICSLMHNISLIGLPEKYHLTEPFDMDSNDQPAYYEHFSSAMQNLSQITQLAEHVKIISQIWAHDDGSGFPNGLSGNQISKCSQIIAIANIYHNGVYRLLPAQAQKLKLESAVIQQNYETKKRHDELLKLLYKKVKWFDYDVFHNFIELIKKRTCPTLIPDPNQLLLTTKAMVEGADQPPQAEPTNTQATGYDNKPDLKPSDTFSISLEEKQGQIIVDKDISALQLKPGMTIAQNILTKTGILVVRQGTRLDAALVKNIKQLDATGLLRGDIVVAMPENEIDNLLSE